MPFDGNRDRLKKRIGLVLGPILFLVILNLPITAPMQQAALSVVLEHCDEQVTREVEDLAGGLAPAEIAAEDVPELLRRCESVKVRVPADFHSTGQRGIHLDSEDGTSLPSRVAQQGRALRAVVAVLALMATWWITECIPIPVTALLPMVLFPLFSIAHFKDARFPGYFVVYSPYMNRLIVLFMGGFMIAEALKKWSLHRRIAMWIMLLVGLSPSRLVLGMMLATAFLSMFVSNTATTAMMMPICLAILMEAKVSLGQSRFGLCLMLGIAYGASVGGIATLIGTPPNVVLAAFSQKFHLHEITFANWLTIGLPFTVVFLPVLWLLLTRVLARPEIDRLEGAQETLRERLSALGTLRWPEKATLCIFVLVGLLWITRTGIGQIGIPGWNQIPGLSWADDSVVAMFGALLLFVIPASWKKVEFLLDWTSAGQIPWGVLLLFGGGLCLGQAMDSTGAAGFLALYLRGLQNVPSFVVLFAVILLVNFLTEVTSNTATTTMIMPILFATAAAIGVEPLGLMIAGAGAASMAFMLPVGTPPNAIVYGTGYVRMNDMIRIGIFLNLTSTFIWALWLYFGVSRFFPSVRF